jgi:riboflavin kinase
MRLLVTLSSIHVQAWTLPTTRRSTATTTTKYFGVVQRPIPSILYWHLRHAECPTRTFAKVTRLSMKDGATTVHGDDSIAASSLPLSTTTTTLPTTTPTSDDNNQHWMHRILMAHAPTNSSDQDGTATIRVWEIGNDSSSSSWYSSAETYINEWNRAHKDTQMTLDWTLSPTSTTTSPESTTKRTASDHSVQVLSTNDATHDVNSAHIVVLHMHDDTDDADTSSIVEDASSTTVPASWKSWMEYFSSSSSNAASVSHVILVSSSGNNADTSWHSIAPQLWTLPWAHVKSWKEVLSSSSQQCHALTRVRARMLPHVLQLRGTVAHGYGRGGAKLGFPTANLPSSDFAQALQDVPTGVYSGWARLKGPIHESDTVIKAVVNIGYSPTFAGQENAEKIVEAHLMSDTPLPSFYGETMRLQLHAFVRPEQKFDTFPALVAQIHADVRDVKALLDQSPFEEFSRDTFLTASSSVSDDTLPSWTWTDSRELWHTTTIQ